MILKKTLLVNVSFIKVFKVFIYGLLFDRNHLQLKIFAKPPNPEFFTRTDCNF